MRPIQWHLKNNWRVPESLEKVIPIPRSLHPHLRWWLEESNVLPGQPLHPLKHALQIFTDASKEEWGTHLNERTARRTWSLPESKLHKPIGTKSGLSGPLLQQHSPGSHRQHNSGCLYQQGRGDEIGLPVCPTVQNPVLVHQETGNSHSTSHPRPAERDRRQAIQTWPDHSNRVVPSPRGFQSYMLPVAPAPSGPFCHQIQHQTATVCVTGPRPPGMGTQSVMGGSGPICFPTSSHLVQSGGEVTKLPMQQNYSDCTRVAQHALVLGSSCNVQSDPTVSAQSAQPGISTIQPDPAQEPVKPEPTCLAPRATAIKEQGFSEAVAARIEASQRGSTRSVRQIYEVKWTIFTKWCLSNQVDFRAPPLKAIADFLLHLFQDRKLQPGTIDGYRLAIADKLGNSSINVGKDENLIRLLDSFHRDRPKGRRGIPSWNLSLVLHQLTKAPFEPLKEVSLKHLTFKTFSVGPGFW